MSQSTIYRRNLRRLARSEQNIRDNRPPVIRVMAALPIFGYAMSKLQETNQYHGNALASDYSLERKTNTFSNAVKENDDTAPLILAGFVGTAMLASSYGMRARSLIPMAMLSPQSGLPSPIYFCPKHVVRMRVAPTYCVVLMAASFVMRSTKSTVSKL